MSTMRVKTEAKRESIVVAAAEVFREAGFEGASMAEIATRAGGSKATLYSYFKSKEELFVAVMLDTARKLFEPTFVALTSEVDDLPKALQKFGERTMEFICSEDSVQMRRAIVSESGRSDIGVRFFETGPKRGLEQMSELLERQMSLGRLKKSDPGLAARQLMALLECETIAPLMLGLRKTLSKAEIKDAVARALQTFFAAYG
jgi:AcrR family transcriptional regulator